MSRLWLALLAGGAVLAALLGGEGRPDGVRPTPVAADGSFSISNSKQGMPIFTASKVGPGASSSGTVTVANAGSQTGFVSLSQSGLAGLSGPLGGSLTDRLRLDVVDISAPAAPTPVYSGPFAALGTRPLGYMAPGAQRTYRFTATFPEGGATDNVYTGSSAGVTYVWTGVEGSPPASRPAGAPPAVSADRVPARLRLYFPRSQRILTRHRLRLRARCSERCLVDVRAELRSGASRFRIRAIRSRRLEANRATWMSVRVPARARRLLRRALVAHRPARFRIFFAARDDAGNPTFAIRNVRLTARRSSLVRKAGAGGAEIQVVVPRR